MFAQMIIAACYMRRTCDALNVALCLELQQLKMLSRTAAATTIIAMK